MTNTSLEQLKRFLNQLFQFDSQDLDFGVYKILHYKRKEIANFVDHLLVDKVKEQLQTLTADETKHIYAQIADLEKEDIIKGWLEAEAGEKKTLEKFGKDKINQYKELQGKVNEATVSIETENQIYNHLTLFFSRYYDKGDFISKRRFGKNEKYMVPYNGEETHFHWANHDQYYIKSSETFNHYAFKVQTFDGNLVVNFKLQDAQLEQGNVKADEPNYFLLAEKSAEINEKKEGELNFVLVNEQAGSNNKELTIFFEYRPLTDKEKTEIKGNNKQDALDEISFESIKKEFGSKPLFVNLWNEQEGKPLLLKKLQHYTRKNNYDFFIHKNLKAFLVRELDYYIKSELVNIDDLYVSDSDDHFDRLKHNLKTIKVFKSIADTIIDFVSQIEDFQKKLWEKKKFVLSTEWVITIDRLVEYIGEEAAMPILEEVSKNEKQIAEWKELFGQTSIGEKGNRNNLPIDTKHYSCHFKSLLLTTLSTKINIEDKTNGLVLNTDNYHGTELTNEKLYQRIDGLYLDPPYNTNASIIIYKNGFKDSSWLSMMSNRLQAINNSLKDKGVFCITIDDYEYSNLFKLLKIIIRDKELRTTIIEYNFRGRVKSNFSITHEYGIWGIYKGEDLITKLRLSADDIKRNLRRTGLDSRRFESPSMFYGIEVDNDSLEIVEIHNALDKDAPIPIHNNTKTTVIWPIDDDGIERRWYYGIDRVREEKNDTVYAKRIKGKIQIHYTKEGKPIRRKAVWNGKKYDASTYGSELINDLFGITKLKKFDFPKSIHAVKDSLESMTYKPNAWFMDYFGGSGTTFHATLLMNNEDNGNRKCFLMEQGKYVDTVIIPRIKKVAFSVDWSKGIPVSKEKGPGCFFKYQRLEQYEESLENIAFNASEDAMQKALEFNQYIPKYFLEFETKDSQTLVNTAAMQDPWDYKLKVWNGFTYDTEQAVDLVETFNYLIGLHMQKCITKEINNQKYQFIIGHNNANKKIAVVWRSVKDWKLEDYKADATALKEELKSFTYDLLYINDQAHIEGYQPIEEVFKNKMLS